jgi:VanZ family protein
MRILRPVLLTLTILYWLLVIAMNHLPRPPHVGSSMSDTTKHLMSFGLLGSLLYLSIWAVRPNRRWPGLYAMALILVYAALDEWTQPLTGRSCEMRDFLADVIGAAAGLFVVGVVRCWLIASPPQKR